MELPSSKNKIVLTFQEMELSSPKIKKVLIFSQKKLFLYFRKLFYKNILYFRKELPSSKNKKIPSEITSYFS